MNDHTKRVLFRVINLLDQYDETSSGLRFLVGNLEGSFSVIQEPLPEELNCAWEEVRLDLGVMLGSFESGSKADLNIVDRTSNLKREIVNAIGKDNNH